MNKEKKEQKSVDNVQDLDVLKDDDSEVVEVIKESEESEFDKLKTTITALQDEVNQLRNDYARAYADTENMRKRLQNEADTTRKYRIQSFAIEILPVIDNLERALEQETSKENEAFKKGVEMIYHQLVDALKKEGVEEIKADGEKFDPNFHQAIMTEKVENLESGMVVQVLQKGYMLKDRILRASMVKVSE